jgi:hypothetical protein
MFEDFRKQAEESDFPEEDQDTHQGVKTSNNNGRFLGMTPAQRFIIALMLLFMVAILAILFLMVTQKIILPVFG